MSNFFFLRNVVFEYIVVYKFERSKENDISCMGDLRFEALRVCVQHTITIPFLTLNLVVRRDPVACLRNYCSLLDTLYST